MLYDLVAVLRSEPKNIDFFLPQRFRDKWTFDFYSGYVPIT